MIDHGSVNPQDPRMQHALTELQMLIQQHYPDAEFEVFQRDDPQGVRLRAIVDTDETDAVLDIVIDKLYELQVEQGLPIYVIPVQPMFRVGEQLQSRPNRGALIDQIPVFPR